MQEKDELEQAVHDLIIDVCEVMHRRGFESASVGAIMRLIGVPEERAQQHDDEEFVLGDDFARMIKQRKQPIPAKAPDGATLH